jgi:hypothetical protein
VAARIGYCGLDRRREPLSGVEVRSCWVGRPLALEDDAAERGPAPEPVPLPDEPYLSGFVPLEPSPRVTVATAPVEAVAEIPPAAPVTLPEGLLWADLEA